MGLGKKILDIKTSDLKNAHKVMRALAILGITEDDLMKIKDVRDMEVRIAELENFKTSIIRANQNEMVASKKGKAVTMEEIVEAFGGTVEEFDPDGKGN